MNVITQVDNLDTKWTFHHLWAHCRTTDSLSIRYSTVLCHCETDSCTMGKMSSSVKYWRQLAICTYRLSICDFKQLWMKITKMAGEMAHWEKHLLCKQENQNQGTQHLCKCWAGVCSGPLVISAQGTQRQRANSQLDSQNGEFQVYQETSIYIYNVESYWKTTPVNFQPPHTCIHCKQYTHRHTQTYTKYAI